MANEYVIAYNNVETGETILKPMSDEEIAQREAEIAAWRDQKAARDLSITEKTEAKASAESKLAALGLTEAEIAALRG